MRKTSHIDSPKALRAELVCWRERSDAGCCCWVSPPSPPAGLPAPGTSGTSGGASDTWDTVAPAPDTGLASPPP